MQHDRGSTPPHQQEMSDATLSEAARHDSGAFAKLYERYSDTVYRYALRRLRDPDVAEDAVAMTFSRALASIGRFEPDGDQAFARWVMTIARNTVIDIVRARRDLVALDTDALAHMRATSGNDPAQALPPDDRARIEREIDALGSPQCEIVVLRLQGWKGPEIADLLEMSAGAVRVAQFRAYGRLRESLKDLDPRSRKGASS